MGFLEARKAQHEESDEEKSAPRCADRTRPEGPRVLHCCWRSRDAHLRIPWIGVHHLLRGSDVLRSALLAIAISFASAACGACGNSSVGNELEGQVKKVVKRTPIFCSDYVEADVSLGVIRNGVGSMSQE